MPALSRRKRLVKTTTSGEYPVKRELSAVCNSGAFLPLAHHTAFLLSAGWRSPRVDRVPSPCLCCSQHLEPYFQQ